MPQPVISVENLSKRYLLGHEAARAGVYNYTALRDVLSREVRRFGRKALDVVRGRQVVQGDTVEEFWALKDVSFEVQEGEVLGIIGRNGAGKSTLLKILSRITEPTSGRVTLRGRVASLLEVGTGFHPELSGRENIYLNGAILGMSRAEVRKKFDEMVAFAEVEKFLDTPVKRYSSGMYVRLAFAVAAHLEPEILIVDEVLAVGDADFQKKCLGKMDEVSRREGRTVLFVSHNLAAVSDLVNRAILLDSGSVAVDGRVADAISTYLSERRHQPVYFSERRMDYASPYIAQAEVRTSDGGGLHQFGEPLDITICVRHQRPAPSAHLGVAIVGQTQTALTTVYAYPPGCVFGHHSGETVVRFRIPKLRLNIGHFSLRIWLSGPPGSEVYEIVDACNFEVRRLDFLSWWTPQLSVYHEEFTTEISSGHCEIGGEISSRMVRN